MFMLLREKLAEVVKAVAPLVLCICLLQIAVLQAPLESFLLFLGGSALAIVGMMLLFIGIDHGILPMGRRIGAELPKKGSLVLIVAVTFALGFATTVAEPDVLVLAEQVDRASQGALPRRLVLYLTAIGMAAFAAIAMLRVIFGWPMKYLLAATYSIMLALAFVSASGMTSLAFDAGSVTTGVLSSPMIIALAIGLSSVLAGRSAAADGFGILGFASIGPIIVLLLTGIVRS